MDCSSIAISSSSSHEDESEKLMSSTEKNCGSEETIPMANKDGESMGLHERYDRVINFIQVPIHVEPFISFGFLICLDTLLFYLVTLPLEACYSTMRHIGRLLSFIIKRPQKDIEATDSVPKACLVIVSLTIMMMFLDPSSLYHSIRGQSIIKLYVIYNVCEVADKLCCSFGLDLIVSFLGTWMGHNNKIRISLWFHFLLCIFYILIHALVYFYQFETLNVAMHSENHALLTLLLSCQFVEIKASVFKKFERENLFQLSCNEMVERLLLFVFCILSFVLTSCDMTIITSLFVIFASEILADWIKHAFITKFNTISCDIYAAFMDVLSRDYSKLISNNTTTRARSESMSTQIGFSPLPLVCLIFRILCHVSVTKCQNSTPFGIFSNFVLDFVYYWVLLFAVQKILGKLLGWISTSITDIKKK